MTSSLSPHHIVNSLPDPLTPKEPGVEYEAGDPDEARRDHWEKLLAFYEENEETIRKSSDVKLDRSDKKADVEEAINSFIDNADIVLDGLAILGKLHPVLESMYISLKRLQEVSNCPHIVAVILAFRQVIKLDIVRRGNDRKITAIQLQMQSMMCALFE